MNSKKAFSLFELLIVLFISSIILIYTFIFTKQLHETQIDNEKLAILKIDLNSTKVIIEKNLPEIVDKIRYNNSTLYYDENIFLEDVSNFSMKKNAYILTIDITLDEKITQTWRFKL